MPKGRSAEQRALDKALADLDRAVAAGLDAVQEHNGPVAQSGAAMNLARALQEHGEAERCCAAAWRPGSRRTTTLSMAELAAALGISKSRAHQLVRAARNAGAGQQQPYG